MAIGNFQPTAYPVITSDHRVAVKRKPLFCEQIVAVLKQAELGRRWQARKSYRNGLWLPKATPVFG